MVIQTLHEAKECHGNGMDLCSTWTWQHFFCNLQDNKGSIQVVAKAGACPDDVREKLSSLKVHSTVAITGPVTQSPKAPNGVEIIPEQLCSKNAIDDDSAETDKEAYLAHHKC